MALVDERRGVCAASSFTILYLVFGDTTARGRRSRQSNVGWTVASDAVWASLEPSKQARGGKRCGFNILHELWEALRRNDLFRERITAEERETVSVLEEDWHRNLGNSGDSRITSLT